jgi:hypothetical protein
MASGSEKKAGAKIARDTQRFFEVVFSLEPPGRSSHAPLKEYMLSEVQSTAKHVRIQAERVVGKGNCRRRQVLEFDQPS